MNFKGIGLNLILLSLMACSQTGVGPRTVTADQDDSLHKETEELNSELKDVDLKNPQSVQSFTARLDALLQEADKRGGKERELLGIDFFLKGESLAVSDEPTLAALFYEYALKIFPTEPKIQGKLATEYIKSNQLTEARLVLQAFVGPMLKDKNFPKSDIDERSILLLGAVYNSLSDNASAKEVYSRLLTLNPKHVEACIFLARTELSLGGVGDSKETDKASTKSAIRVLKSCQKTNPKEGLYDLYLGKLFLEQGDRNLAEKHLVDAAKKSPEHLQSNLALGLYFEEKENFAKAVKIYEDFLKRVPKNKIVLSRLVQLLFSISEYDRVIPFAEILSNLDASDINLKVKLGILYSDAKKYELALRMFEDIHKEVPDSDKIVYYLAAIHQEVGNYDMAMEYYRKIMEESTLFVDSNLQISYMLQALALKNGHQQNHQENFLNFVSEASRKDPALKTELLMVKANYLEGRGKLKEALDVFKSLESSKVKFTENQLYFFAILNEKAGEYDEAVRLIEKVLIENPKHAHALNFLGYTLLDRNQDFEKARGFIHQALEIAPQDAYIRDSMGWYYFKTQQYQKALKELQFAWERAKTDKTISEHLTLTYKALNRIDEGKKYFKVAMGKSRQESERDASKRNIQVLDNLSRLPASRNH